jgi:uncharacterized protein (TIRG00374 family)
MGRSAPTPRASAEAASPGAGEPAPLPSAVSARRVRQGLLRLGALIVVAGVVVTLAPGLGELRDRFARAQPVWIVVGCVLELMSALSYVPAFRVVFCERMSWATSYKISMAEQGADSLLPVGGAGGLALGAWSLRRGGMPAAEIGRKTVAFFLLTSVPNVGTLFLMGVGLATGVLPGDASKALTIIPAGVALGAVALSLAVGRLAGRIESRLRARTGRSRLARIAPALRALADGVTEAVRLLRRGNPLLLLGLVGYMLFDILVLWASFRALGYRPEVTIVWIAYLIGQLGNLIPLPGGIGGVELGLIGTLVLYGLPAVAATAAVLLYRVIELWIPAALGVPAFFQLRRLLRHETQAIALCRPGDTVEIVGLGPVVAGHDGLGSRSARGVGGQQA